MRRKEPEFKHIEGWNMVTGCRSFCGGCGHMIDFQDPLYHRKDGDREVIRCFSCASIK